MEVKVIDLSNNREAMAKSGLSSVVDASKNLSSVITVLVGSKRQFPMSLLQSFLSPSETEILKKDQQVILNNGSKLRLESSHTISKAPETPVLFIVYGWSEIIPKVRRAIGVKHITVLAPNNLEADAWRNEFG